MEAPDFWDNAEISQKKMKELKGMKDDMETYQNLVTQKEDMETLIEMSYEENDPSMIEEIQEMLDEFQAQFDSIRVKTFFQESMTARMHYKTECRSWWNRSLRLVQYAVSYVYTLG